MTCEFSDIPCEDCHIDYCPEQIEELNFEYLDLQGAVKAAQKELEYREKNLEDFRKEHEAVLI